MAEIEKMKVGANIISIRDDCMIDNEKERKKILRQAARLVHIWEADKKEIKPKNSVDNTDM